MILTTPLLSQRRRRRQQRFYLNAIKSLYALWSEYEFGLANHKAAKDFNAVERGRVKYVYHRRKVVWDQVTEMVRSGWSAHEACDIIYDVYEPIKR